MYNPQQIQEDVQKFWKKSGTPENIVKFDQKKKKFYLLDGPPYVNYDPHVGHIKTTTFKDVWGKFKYMQGYSVWFQPGFDCSGLPIENAVEKKLGIKSKRDIEKFGVKKFIEECKKLAEKNKPVWMDIYKKIGSWKAWLEPYMTYKNYYLESGWWSIKQIYDKGLLVEGHKPGFWCSHCETVLAGYEVTDSYKNVEDPSILIKFPLRDEKDTYLLVWTTTPWTLPSNVAIAAHSDENYVKVEIMSGEKLILAEKRIEVLTNLDIGYKIVDKFKGKKLDGLKYKGVVDVKLQKEMDEKFHYVIMSIKLLKKRAAAKISGDKKDEFDDFVTMDTGTGLVHTAPGLGDNKVGDHYKLAFLSPIDDQGRFTEDVDLYKGIHVKKADAEIIKDLQENNRLLHVDRITHSYPLCWRCKTPLIYRMSKQWFLKIEKIRNSMIKDNKTVTWLPEFGREQFNDLIISSPDWAITRQRYWGIPMPIWVCDKCDAKKVIGSRQELAENSVDRISEDIDLHKDSVDEIKLKCSCGNHMERVKDIMDVWFDSGISPWASLGYPFQNEKLFKKLWPIDLIDESQDQIRGWFNSLMACSHATFGKKPYDVVCMNGWTLDEKGNKMSKSVGNVVSAFDAYEKLGADLLRLYICYDNPPWETQKFGYRKAQDIGKSLNVLWNTHEFIKTYSKKAEIPKELNVEDKWILSRVNTTIDDVTKFYENFEFHKAARSIVDFMLNDFSRWYIKIIRDRVSPTYDGKDKTAAQGVLSYILERVIKLLAPISPFISEKIYQEAFGNDSVHMSEWPVCDKKYVDKKLEEQMIQVKDIVELAAALRQDLKIKLRWPVSELLVSGKVTDAVKNLESVLNKMSNVKTTKYSEKIKGQAKTDHDITVAFGEVLKDEALLRELIRNIQEVRKKSKFSVHDSIILYLKDHIILKRFEQELKQSVGAKEIKFGSIKHAKGKLEFEDNKIEFGFEKV